MCLYIEIKYNINIYRKHYIIYIYRERKEALQTKIYIKCNHLNVFSILTYLLILPMFYIAISYNFFFNVNLFCSFVAIVLLAFL